MKKFRHYIRMMDRNRKKYLFLSVTITMSFMLLFLYLAITDSNIYNTYKEVLGTTDKIAIVFGTSDDKETNKRMHLLSEQLSEEDHYYIYYEQQQMLNQYGNVNAQIQFIPNSIWAHYVYSDNFINPVKFEEEDIQLKDDEAIVEKIYICTLKVKVI